MTDDLLEIRGRSRVPAIITPAVRALLRRAAVGRNVSVGYGLRVGRGTVLSAPHRLELGHWVSVGPRSIVQVNGSIGSFGLIGMGVQIVGREDHAIDEVGRPMSLSTWVADRSPSDRDQVRIGRDVWVGGSSVVLSGVTIGEGAVIGAGSVVTHDVPPFGIAVGTPARTIRLRFESDQDREAHSAKLTELEQQALASARS